MCSWRTALPRRHFLARPVLTIQGTIGATLAFIVGSTTLAPSFARRDMTWLRAASLDAIPEDEPLPVTLRLTRPDGFTPVVERTLVYLTRDGGEIRAFGSTCTHLGCRTSHDRMSGQIVCPCHGGVSASDGSSSIPGRSFPGRRCRSSGVD
jgi:succinate dehydrogenase / fumarate reductase iron-sulfur subunit